MALEMAESISTELPTHFFHLLPGVGGWGASVGDGGIN